LYILWNRTWYWFDVRSRGNTGGGYSNFNIYLHGNWFRYCQSLWQ